MSTTDWPSISRTWNAAASRSSMAPASGLLDGVDRLHHALRGGHVVRPDDVRAVPRRERRRREAALEALADGKVEDRPDERLARRAHENRPTDAAQRRQL